MFVGLFSRESQKHELVQIGHTYESMSDMWYFF